MNEDTISSTKSLVFVQDDVKAKDVKKEEDGSKRKARKKTPGVTVKNFGSRLSTSSFQSCSELGIAWRCRRSDLDGPCMQMFVLSHSRSGWNLVALMEQSSSRP